MLSAAPHPLAPPAPPPPGWRPSTGARRAAWRVLTEGHLSDASRSESARLEAAAADLLHVPAEAVRAFASGSGALYAALLALGIGRGERVLLSALAPPYVAGVVDLAGGRAVPVDAEPDGLGIDAVQAASVHAAQPAGALLWAAGLEPERPLAWPAPTPWPDDLPVLEDAAALLAARDRLGRPIGTRGAAGVFSLAYGKALGAGEGGLLVAADGVVRARLRALDGAPAARGRPRAPRLGALGRLPLLTTTLALASLPDLDARRAARQNVSRRLAAIASAAGVASFATGGEPLWAGRFATAAAARRAQERAQRLRLELAAPATWCGRARALPVARDSIARVRILPWWDAGAARPAELETLARAFGAALGVDL